MVFKKLRYKYFSDYENLVIFVNNIMLSKEDIQAINKVDDRSVVLIYWE